MPVEYAGSTLVASRLLRYTVKPKPGQTEKERVLHISGQHCRPETAEREFAATRRKHGTHGAIRKSPAKYELPEPDETATHIRKVRPGGRKYWVVAPDGKPATHMRREGEIVKQAEARHLITSFALDEVNPDDPDQVAKAFAYVAARHAALYPGEQATFVGQAEGKGKKFHVHTTRNATLFADMELDGKLYKAGTKLAGDLTDIDKMRERADTFLTEHGAEYGLASQRLASVKDQKREKRTSRDRRMKADGEISNHDMIREAFELSMDDPRAMNLDSFIVVMAEHGVKVTEPGKRRGKSPTIPKLSYKIDGMGTPVRGGTLGEHYSYESAVAQLEANATGQTRELRPQPVQAGPPRPVAVPTVEELTEAQAIVDQLAREERLHVWLDEWARDERTTVEEILLERALSLHNEEDRELLHKTMRDWTAAQQAALPQPTATTRSVQMRKPTFDEMLEAGPAGPEWVPDESPAVTELTPATPAPAVVPQDSATAPVAAASSERSWMDRVIAGEDPRDIPDLIHDEPVAPPVAVVAAAPMPVASAPGDEPEPIPTAPEAPRKLRVVMNPAAQRALDDISDNTRGSEDDYQP